MWMLLVLQDPCAQRSKDVPMGVSPHIQLDHTPQMAASVTGHPACGPGSTVGPAAQAALDLATLEPETHTEPDKWENCGCGLLPSGTFTPWGPLGGPIMQSKPRAQQREAWKLIRPGGPCLLPQAALWLISLNMSSKIEPLLKRTPLRPPQ